MAQYKLIPCPKTKKLFRVQLPLQPCNMDITCPCCGEIHTLHFGPESVSKEEKIIEAIGYEGEEQRVTCPECQEEIVYTAQMAGIMNIQCSHCKAQLKQVIKEKTKPNVIKGMGIGQLVQMQKTFIGQRKVVYRLHEGSNVVGRYSDGVESDISIKGDEFMSRRSISIEVIQVEKGYLYKLRILRAANPVCVNDSPLQVDESRYLNFGDKITLGKTTFIFEKKEK